MSTLAEAIFDFAEEIERPHQPGKGQRLLDQKPHISRLREARRLLDELRQAQKDDPKSLKGRNSPDTDERKDNIAHIHHDSSTIKAAFNADLPKDGADVAYKLEKLFNRHKFKVDQVLWPYIHRILIMETAANAAELDMPIEQARSYTIHHGAPDISLRADPRNKGLSDGALRRAAYKNSANPQDYLDRCAENYEALRADPQNKDVPDGALRNAAYHYPTNPQDYLDRCAENYEALRADPQNKDVLDGALRFTAYQYPENPQAIIYKLKAGEIQMGPYICVNGEIVSAYNKKSQEWCAAGPDAEEHSSPIPCPE